MKSLGIKTRVSSDYQRENFDKFLKNVKFSFAIPAIHIAGTNGKGSTANYISNIYIKSGLKVGLFSSPYFYDINELMKVNNVNARDEDINSILDQYKSLFEKFDLSEFEIESFIAFEYFKKCNCDVCIFECGMGGEIDATNIFTPILSVITSVSLEHTTFLGKTISEIAYQKAGIIKQNVPVLIGDLDDDAVTVIKEVADDLHSRVIRVGVPANITIYKTLTFDYLTFKNLEIKTPAKYSAIDACFAIDAVTILNDQLPVSEKNIRDGLYDSFLPCRLEVFKRNRTIILDGAHNPEAMRNLKENIRLLPEISSICSVFSCFKDKNLPSLLSELGEISNNIILTSFNHPRARKFEDYFLFADDYNFIENPVEAINEALTKNPNSVLLVTGSLAFTAYVRKLIEEGEIKDEIIPSKE